MSILMPSHAAPVLLAVLLLAGSSRLAAQTPSGTLVGVVRDTGGAPVAGVEIWVRGSDVYAHSGENGGFNLGSVPAGATRVTLRRLGFEPTTFEVQVHSGQTDSLIVSLNQVAVSLERVTVEEEQMTRSKRLLAGFWERRSHGFGHFVTRAEIEARDAHQFTEIVRMTPGVNIVSINGRPSIRFSRSIGGRGDCPPQYWVDGMHIENASADEFSPSEIEALEIYAGPSTIPPQFAERLVSLGPKTCGAIVIWTRLPGS
ncbi:MAG: carboxypeptidase regulatory-like domain-containing protein [bacterium]